MRKMAVGAAWTVVVCVGLAMGGCAMPAGRGVTTSGPKPTRAATAIPDGLWSVVLEKALGDRPISLLLSSSEGQWKHAIVSARYSRGLHDADVSALAFAGGKLNGQVKIVLSPDHWVPPDKKPVTCTVAIDAAATNGSIAGTYKGTKEAEPIVGIVSGKQEAPKGAAKAGTIQLVLEDALVGGEPFHHQAAVNVTLQDGKAVRGTIEWYKKDPRHWTGRVNSMDLQLTADALTGEIRADIRAGAAPVQEGVHTFILDGQVIGETVAGRFKAKLGDKDLSGGVFIGTINASAREAAATPK
jgi:hypothetical protein